MLNIQRLAGNRAATHWARRGSETDTPVQRFEGLAPLSETPIGAGGEDLASLKRGSSGPLVALLQTQLNAVTPQPDPLLNADGQFGGLTETAVRAFQSVHGLEPDGRVGPATTRALFDSPDAGGADPALSGGGGEPSSEAIASGFFPDAGNSTVCAADPECPKSFCTPFSSKEEAIAVRDALAPILLHFIGREVNEKVVPIWELYLNGGSPPQDFSDRFGKDFAENRATTKAMDRIAAAVSRRLAEAPTLAPTSGSVTLPLEILVPDAIAELENLGSADRMAFQQSKSVPGNLAGDVGKNQAACPSGAQPSTFDDSRSAVGTVVVSRGETGEVIADVNATFTVRDTADLCPAQCGLFREKFATVPMSRFESTGISGDVPFTVVFAGPPRRVTPSSAGPTQPQKPQPGQPQPGPVEGEVTASALRVRAGPTTSSAIVRTLPRGSPISITCQTTGDDVEGNSTWDKVDDGFVADRFVRRSSEQQPPPCS